MTGKKLSIQVINSKFCISFTTAVDNSNSYALKFGCFVEFCPFRSYSVMAWSVFYFARYSSGNWGGLLLYIYPHVTFL